MNFRFIAAFILHCVFLSATNGCEDSCSTTDKQQENTQCKDGVVTGLRKISFRRSCCGNNRATLYKFIAYRAVFIACVAVGCFGWLNSVSDFGCSVSCRRNNNVSFCQRHCRIAVGKQFAAGAYIVVNIAVLCAGGLDSINRHKMVGMNVSQHRSDFVSADCAGFSGGFSRFTA